MPLFSTDRASQLSHFQDADPDHYRWQTAPGYFADTESSLVHQAELGVDGRLLEIGCGEGGNLFHLGSRPGWVGVDFSRAKLAHASAQLPDARFAVCDAAHLPFADDSFDAVLIRDLLHHVPDRPAVVREAVRVLRPGGRLAVIEPNRYHPLIVAQALLLAAERAALRSTAKRLRTELERAGLEAISIATAQPLPLARVVLHPGFGLGRLGDNRTVASLLEVVDRAARRLVPRAVWMYLVAGGRKSPAVHDSGVRAHSRSR